MTSRKIIGAALLAAAASSAWGYQVRTTFQSNGLLEGDGFQTVTVEVEREVSDDPSLCIVDVPVTAQGFSQPPPDAATPGVDFQTTSTTLTFSVDVADTVVSQTFNVPVIDDSLQENTESFTAVIGTPAPVDCAASPAFNIDTTENFFPILDDDGNSIPFSFANEPYQVAENGGSATVTLHRIGGTAGPLVVYYQAVDGTAVDGTDYTGVNGSVTWADGDGADKTFTVPILDDTAVEGNESVLIRAGTDSDFVAFVQTTLNIVDDDGGGPQFAFANAPYQIAENGGSAAVTVSRQGGTAGALTVFYRTTDGTAAAGSDYQAVTGNVTWADGDGADKTFTVPIVDDAVTEPDETVLLDASTDAGFASSIQATLTITNDDVTTTGFSVASASTTEADGQVVLTLVRAGDTAGVVTVDYATADGTAVAGQDYVAAAGTVTWADGDGADKTVSVQILPDTNQEQAEDFVVKLSNITGSAQLGSNSSITVTIDASGTREIAGIANLSPNQAALAGWFDQTCPRLNDLPSPSSEQQELSTVCNLLTSPDTDDDTVRRALDAINPEELLVSTFDALRLTALQHGNISQRLNALRNGATGLSLVDLNLDIGGQQIAGRALQEMFDKLVGGGASGDDDAWGRWGGFVNGRISSGDQKRSDHEAGFDFDLYSVTTGVDYRLQQNFIVGVSASFGSVNTDFTGGGGGLDIDNWDTAGYLTYYKEDSFYLDALVTYGGNDYDSRRTVSLVTPTGNVDRVGRGKTDGKQYSLGFGTGWDLNHGGFTFGPHFGGYYFNVKVDGFSETGAGGLDVHVNDQSSTSMTLNGGGHFSYAWLTDWGVLVPNARVDWVHEFENNRETLAFNFVNDPFAGDPNNPSPTITLQSNRPDPNYLIWSVGVSAQFIYGLSGFVDYQAYSGYGGINMSEWSFGGRWEKTF